MIKKLFKRFSSQNGQAAIIIGLMIATLIGAVTYVVDVGSIYEARRTYQTIADSSALSGIQELPENPSRAIQSAIDYAAMQGVSLDSSDITISSTFVADDTITVTASNPQKQLFFGWVFGRNDTPVGADATAMVGMPAEFLGVVPWGVPEEEWTPGGNYTLKCGPPGQGGGAQTGNFQALAIGGTGASNYEENCATGADIPLHIGDVVDTEPGNMKGPTIDGTETRIYDYEDYNFNTFGELTESVDGGYALKRNDSQFVICPIIPELPAGRDEVELIKFVPFIITQITGSEVIGTFLNKAIIKYDGEMVGIDDSGIRVIRLIH